MHAEYADAPLYRVRGRALCEGRGGVNGLTACGRHISKRDAAQNRFRVAKWNEQEIYPEPARGCPLEGAHGMWPEESPGQGSYRTGFQAYAGAQIHAGVRVED